MENGKRLEELKEFHKQLKTYQRYIESDRQLSEAQERYKNSLIEKLQRKFGGLKDIITQLSGNRRWERFGYVHEIWIEGLSSEIPLSYIRPSLKMCIDATNEAIGKLESTPIAELEAQEAKSVVAESPLQIFDAMKFHPRVVEASKSCFVTGNYREAILNAFIRLIDYVKEITGLDLDGDNLMNKVFSFNYDKNLRRITKYPIIRINELKNSNDRNEQQGFMFLCKGAAGGIRNPKAHKLIPQSNPLHTLEYLAFASLLMRRIEEGKVVKLQKNV